MNKTAIKNFAVWARVNLIEAVKQRAYEYEITKDGVNNASLESVGGRILSRTERDQRRALINEISEKGFDQVMEEAAYTWFNRFIALRFMEVNGYLPARVRVFTNEEGEFKPEIMKEAMTVEIEGLNREKVLDLIDKQNNEELFKYLIITQCNALGNGLPKMFEKIEHWTELLFPANLLRADSVVGKMVNEMPEEDWQDAVQIIGWLYQYYNTELKDDTFAKLKKNIKISKERIPAATQLFTPDWIVRYMVENSLGRIYISDQLSVVSGKSESERIEAEKAIAEKMGWRYYLPEAEQTPEVRAQLNQLTTNNCELTTLKIIDPCMGSGHILVYAFDVLMQMYTASGWSERDAAKSIVENNLFGLDIDDRAGQLAYFAVMMKARKYNRRALAGGASGILPNVYAIQESNTISHFAVEDFCNGNAKALEEMNKLLRQMKDAKEYGSILNIKDIDFELLFSLCDSSEDRITLHNNEIREDIVPLVKIAYIMAQKYDAVITNPPYMGGSGMSAKLTEFVKNNYPDSKSDLFAVFIERCATMLKKNGYQAMITQHAWMFLASYEKLREKILKRDTINMVHLGARAFEEIGGEVVQTTSFVLRASNCKNFKGTYCRLIEPNTQYGKEEMFLSGKNKYTTTQSDFTKIPGAPIAYWINKSLFKAFSISKNVGNYSVPRAGIMTGDENRFARLWMEVGINNTSFTVNNYLELVKNSAIKWVPITHGGTYRKWYGNGDYVVNMKNCGEEISKQTGNFRLREREYYFRKGITWTKISSSSNSFRVINEGTIFGDAGPTCFIEKNTYEILGLLNSKVGDYIANIINPTLNTVVGDIAAIPVIDSLISNEKISNIVEENLENAKQDWNSFETSWDFKKHPLI